MTKYRHIINTLILATLVLTTSFSIYTVSTTYFGFEIRHYIGSLFTIATIIAFVKNKNLFSLFLLFHLLIGNFCGLSCLVHIPTNSLFFNIGSLSIPLYWGQPFYSILLFIYIIFNKGFFIGIVTKEYWADFLTRTKDLEVVFTTIKPNDNSTASNSADTST